MHIRTFIVRSKAVINVEGLCNSAFLTLSVCVWVCPISATLEHVWVPLVYTTNDLEYKLVKLTLPTQSKKVHTEIQERHQSSSHGRKDGIKN